MGGKASKEKCYEDHVLPHSSELEELVPNTLWRLQGTLPFPLPRCMVLYRLPNTKKMLVWSPIAVDEEMSAKIRELGEIEVIVIPSTHHTMDTLVFKERFAPRARVVCPASVRAQLSPDMTTGTIEEEVENGGIKGALSADGMPEGGELALIFELGQGRAALCLCDLLFNILEESDTWFGRFVGKHVFGSFGPLHVTKFGKRFFVKDRQALAKWLTVAVREKIENEFKLDLTIITVAHGTPVLSECYENLQLAAERLLV